MRTRTRPAPARPSQLHRAHGPGLLAHPPAPRAPPPPRSQEERAAQEFEAAGAQAELQGALGSERAAHGRTAALLEARDAECAGLKAGAEETGQALKHAQVGGASGASACVCVDGGGGRAWARGLPACTCGARAPNVRRLAARARGRRTPSPRASASCRSCRRPCGTRWRARSSCTSRTRRTSASCSRWVGVGVGKGPRRLLCRA